MTLYFTKIFYNGRLIITVLDLISYTAIFPTGSTQQVSKVIQVTPTEHMTIREKQLQLYCLQSFARNLDNFCSPSAHLMFWFSMKNYQELLTFFKEETDFAMQYIPLIWSKHLGIISDPQRSFRNQCEFCLFGSRGDRKIVRTASNHYHGLSMDREHMSGKYEPMLRHFFSALIDNTTLMLDPTCGSGTSLIAAESLGAQKVLGLEIDPEFVKVGNLAVDRARVLRKISEST